MDDLEFENRKRDHIRLALDRRNQAEGLGGLDSLALPHEALPDCDLKDVDLREPQLWGGLFYIAGMTAGHDRALEINAVLAESAETRGWGFGVGSQRRDYENWRGRGPQWDETVDQWKAFAERFHKLFYFGNLGITQIASDPNAAIDWAQTFVQVFKPQAMVVHLNALQEAIQKEGTPIFSGALESLRRWIEALPVPVIIKETGCGFSRSTLERLRSVAVSKALLAVDVSGLGGTHWGRIEAERNAMGRKSGDPLLRLQSTFGNWGVSTAQSVVNATSVFHETPTEVWASGGIRTGVDAAKCVALGARRVGFAQPALAAALQSRETLLEWMQAIEREMTIALFCTGHRSASRLRGVVRDEGIFVK